MKRTTRNILLNLVYFLFTASFLVLVVSAKIQRDLMPLQSITIDIDHASGQFFITESDIALAIQDHVPQLGAVLQQKDLRDIENRLEEVPQVADANVFVDNLGRLSIEIRQRTPLYRVIRPDNVSYYVDEGGFKFPLSSSYTAKVPVVTGFTRDAGPVPGQAEDRMNQELLLLFQVLNNDKFWLAQFGQVHINERQEFELVPRAGSHTVLLGSVEDLDKKLERLRIFYHEGIHNTGWDAYSSINVKYNNQVICKK